MKKFGSMVFIIAALAAAALLLPDCGDDDDNDNPCLDLVEEYSLLLCDQCEDWFDFCDCVELDGYYDCDHEPEITCIFECAEASNYDECECNIAGLVYNEGTGECEELDPECNEVIIEALRAMIDDFVCPGYTPCVLD